MSRRTEFWKDGHYMLVEWNGKRPHLGERVFVAPSAVLVGDVHIGDDVSIWYGAVLRGDFDAIVVGSGSNVQDNVVIHTAAGEPTQVGSNVTIGHGAVLEACTIGHGAVIGMNAVVLNGATVGAQAMVAAGSVVTERAEVPERCLAAGAPAVVKKELAGRSLEWVGMAAPEYRTLAASYLEAGLGDTTD